MVAYAGIIAIVYLLFFRTHYKRLISERTESGADDVLPAEPEQRYTLGHNEPRNESFENDKTNLCSSSYGESNSNRVEHSEKF